MDRMRACGVCDVGSIPTEGTDSCYIYNMSFDKNDEERITLYKSGNEEVFRELINKYTSPLFNFTARLTDKNNASDIVQETFIKVWKNINKFDINKASFKTWIFTVAKNTATDFLRKKRIYFFPKLT